MERPTIVSSGPDAMGRTVYFEDEMSRRARYGRIRPMEQHNSIASIFTRWMSPS